MKTTTTVTEYAIRHSVGFFVCRSLEHAKGMMSTTSPVLGAPASRTIVTRQVTATEWTPVKEES